MAPSLLALDQLRVRATPEADATFTEHLSVQPTDALHALAGIARSRDPPCYAEALAILCARLATAARTAREARAAGHYNTTESDAALLDEWKEMVDGAPVGYVGAMVFRWVATAREAARVAVCGGDTAARELVLPMRRACGLLAPNKEHALPLHADYIALCVHAKAYEEALWFVPERGEGGIGVRTVYDPVRTGISAADVLCEFYYLAVVHIVRKNYGEALQACRLALAVPSSTLSDVAVAAYRKFVLVSLLHVGRMLPPPVVSSYTTSRLKSYATEYVDLAKAFSASNFDEFRKLAASHAAQFEEHENSGLIALLLKALPRRKIIALTSSFVTLGLEQIASRVELSSASEAEALVLDMVAKGSIRAKIDAQKQVVRFLSDDQEDRSEEASVAKAMAVARAIWGDVASGIDADVPAQGGEGKKGFVRIGKPTIEKRMEAALACVETIHSFKNVILSDSGFVSRILSSEREARMHAGDGGIGIGMEEADHDGN